MREHRDPAAAELEALTKEYSDLARRQWEGPEHEEAKRNAARMRAIHDKLVDTNGLKR